MKPFPAEIHYNVRQKVDRSVSLQLSTALEQDRDQFMALHDLRGEHVWVSITEQEPIPAPVEPPEPPQAPAPEPPGEQKTASQRLRGTLWKRWEEVTGYEGSTEQSLGFEEWYQNRMNSIINAVREGRI